MNKLFSTIAIAALASLALSGAASAGPGNGNNNGQVGGLGGAQINLGGFGGAKGGGGGYSGGEIASPGDAFYPGGAPQSREDACHAAGGNVVVQIEDGRSVFTCIL